MSEQRLIDANKIEFKGLNNRVCPDLSAQDIIDEAPTVPAEVVVHCRDCKYKTQSKVNKKGFLICPASGMEITDGDFCSYGERRESEAKP